MLLQCRYYCCLIGSICLFLLSILYNNIYNVFICKAIQFSFAWEGEWRCYVYKYILNQVSMIKVIFKGERLYFLCLIWSKLIHFFVWLVQEVFKYSLNSHNDDSSVPNIWTKYLNIIINKQCWSWCTQLVRENNENDCRYWGVLKTSSTLLKNKLKLCQDFITIEAIRLWGDIIMKFFFSSFFVCYLNKYFAIETCFQTAL